MEYFLNFFEVFLFHEINNLDLEFILLMGYWKVFRINHRFSLQIVKGANSYPIKGRVFVPLTSCSEKMV